MRFILVRLSIPIAGIQGLIIVFLYTNEIHIFDLLGLLFKRIRALVYTGFILANILHFLLLLLLQLLLLKLRSVAVLDPSELLVCLNGYHLPAFGAAFLGVQSVGVHGK